MRLRVLERTCTKNVLIALDDSQPAERALHRAKALAEIENGDLFVVVVNEGLLSGSRPACESSSLESLCEVFPLWTEADLTGEPFLRLKRNAAVSAK
jgi:nucleotide-binding universal stress UspA family protein